MSTRRRIQQSKSETLGCSLSKEQIWLPLSRVRRNIFWTQVWFGELIFLIDPLVWITSWARVVPPYFWTRLNMTSRFAPWSTLTVSLALENAHLNVAILHWLNNVYVIHNTMLILSKWDIRSIETKAFSLTDLYLSASALKYCE